MAKIVLNTIINGENREFLADERDSLLAVSYTHLTLPTNREV